MSHRGLSHLELRFFDLMHGRKRPLVRTEDVAQSLSLTAIRAAKLLSDLNRRSVIARVRRGLYLAPPTFPPGGKWTPSEATAINSLMQDHDGVYQISGQNAFVRYGWSDQIPNRLFLYNNRLSGEFKIGAIQLTCAKLSGERLGAIEVVKTREERDLVYSSRPRALLDAVYDWSRFNTLPRAYHWIRQELKASERMAADLVVVCQQYGNQITMRRIGLLLELEGIQGTLLRRLHKALRPTASPIPWDPTQPTRQLAALSGDEKAISHRWGVVKNAL